MAKKEDLKNSFGGGSRRRKKPILSDAEINKIAEEREVIKKGVVSETNKSPTKTEENALKPKPTAKKRITPTPKKVKKLKRVVQEGDEAVIKTSLDMPVSLYEEMKIHLIRQKKSMREYLLDMIKSDLAKHTK